MVKYRHLCLSLQPPNGYYQTSAYRMKKQKEREGGRVLRKEKKSIILVAKEKPTTAKSDFIS